ncbi:SGNH/GDSL hydrolase family protein [Streptomyces sp. S.PB5]|uniref:SGNH/GDSL hydrolase family protein n=1 Tax=Streptomyces sp. S.PB5 TaxID=3020844 RepID=UPI0025B04CD9|nr:SGNH/GDSL hydrolase family protein [Streptomyces sp. S.PB5]MDN3023548.1 SGNH/GDSL hydrolase family protein [Streptomyces sp. S.PB5]
MRRFKSAVVSAVLAFAGLAATAGAPAHAATGVDYVALGDSYAAGVGAGHYDSAAGDCKRSSLSYPALWAAVHDEARLTDVSCSGATIADVRAGQLSALNTGTDLVTLTVGGNDAQFSSVVKACLTESDSYCRTATDWMSYYAKNQLVDELAALYKDIKARAPHAEIIVLGYPQALSTIGTCPVIDLSAAKRTYMNNLADALAVGAEAAAAKEPVTFLDVRDAFKGHGACGSDSWINDLTAGTEVFHPTPAGYIGGYYGSLEAELS